jgi:PIN domain nuclease of toxin-antitoxin system
VIVIDTHVLVWALQDDKRLGPRARQAIATASQSSGILVSAITPWEIALLTQNGILALPQVM